MNHKRAFETLDRTPMDIRNYNSLMGGIPVLCSGDFRKIILVIPKMIRANEIQSPLKSSTLWRYVKALKLKINMKAYMYEDTTSNQFAANLLSLGERRVPIDSKNFTDPSPICTLTPSTLELSANFFPYIKAHHQNGKWLFERAILVPNYTTINSSDFEHL